MHVKLLFNAFPKDIAQAIEQFITVYVRFYRSRDTGVHCVPVCGFYLFYLKKSSFQKLN